LQEFRVPTLCRKASGVVQVTNVESTAGFAISTLGKTITREISSNCSSLLLERRQRKRSLLGKRARTNGFPVGRSVQRGDKVMPV
jgi:hypothetical protein